MVDDDLVSLILQLSTVIIAPPQLSKNQFNGSIHAWAQLSTTTRAKCNVHARVLPLHSGNYSSMSIEQYVVWL